MLDGLSLIVALGIHSLPHETFQEQRVSEGIEEAANVVGRVHDVSKRRMTARDDPCGYQVVRYRHD